MVASISPDPRLQFFANDGSPLVGGKLYTYAAGTTTPLVTYTSSTGLTANTNPVILDSRGEASVWLGTSKYKFVLKDADDVEIWSQDQLAASALVDGTNATGTWPISITGNAATATSATTADSATTAAAVTGGYVSKIVAGTNISISPTSGVGNVTINAVGSNVGTVTSINASAGSGFSFSGGPVTTSGTLALTVPAVGASGNVLTSDGTNWASAAPATTTLGAIGSYAFVKYGGTGALAAGTSVAGSSLTYGGAYIATCGGSLLAGASGTLSGTWKIMGYMPASAVGQALSLAVRTA